MIPHSSGYKPLALPITLLQRVLLRLSGAPARFRPFKQGFGQVRLPLRATHSNNHQSRIRTHNEHPAPRAALPLSYLALVEMALT